MGEVDLELPAAELVVAHARADVQRAEPAQGAQQVSVRVAAAARGVDVAGSLGVPLPAGGRPGRRVAEEVLQFRADDRLDAFGGALVQYVAQQVAGGFGGGRSGGGVGDVAEAGGDARLPGQRGERAQVGAYADVRQSGVQAARHVDDVALRAGVVDGPAEGEAVVAGRGQVVEQYVAGAVGADEVGIGHPDHVDAVGGQAVHVLPDLGGVVSAHQCLLGGAGTVAGRGRTRAVARATGSHLKPNGRQRPR